MRMVGVNKNGPSWPIWYNAHHYGQNSVGVAEGQTTVVGGESAWHLWYLCGMRKYLGKGEPYHDGEFRQRG